jgi:hypothetical protein
MPWLYLFVCEIPLFSYADATSGIQRLYNRRTLINELINAQINHALFSWCNKYCFHRICNSKLLKEPLSSFVPGYKKSQKRTTRALTSRV